MRMLKVICVLIFLSLFACTNSKNNDINTTNNDTIVINSLQLKYAKWFAVDYYKNYKKITVFNPWDNNSVYWQYFIVNDSLLIKPNKNGKFYMLNSSLDNVLQLSGTQVSMFVELGLLSKIKAVGQKKYLYNKKILSNSKIIELGNEQNLNTEKLITKNINAVFTTGWDKVSDNFKKLTELGIPIIYSLDWQEQSPLARAEWIKFIACFYNKEEVADAYFNKIEKKYLELKTKVEGLKNKPTVFNGNSISGTWYVAGSNSYLVQLFTDAGAAYIFNNNNLKASQPLSFETVYSKAKDADYWIASGNADFSGADERYKMFKAYKKNNIYINNKRVNHLGGNDYWESGVIHPELQLQDFINIFHNGVLNNSTLVYYKQIYNKE